MTEEPSWKYEVQADRCPSCERYIGPVGVCPYCGCDSARHPVYRVLRIASLLLAFTGIVFLYFMARRSEPPAVAVDSITPLMNYAYVRISGTLEKDAYIARKDGRVEYLSFLINDGTGSIRIAAYDEVAEEMEKSGVVTRKKSRIEAAGTISASGDGRKKLIIRSVNDVRACE